MKFAAVQMEAEFANVNKNLNIAKRLAEESFDNGADCVILPEFFTSAMGFHPNMLDVVRKIDGTTMRLLKDLSYKYDGIIGGSFIAFKEGECYNTFALVFPDGSVFYHDKDQPTMWENCYYIGGSDDGILLTEIGNVGVSLCWEFIRTRTAKRLINKVDILFGGSCWWTVPKKEVKGVSLDVHELNVELMKKTPSRMAKILGVPVIHAAHAGSFQGLTPKARDLPYNSFYLGETQIVDGSGKILKRLSYQDGEGYVIADVNMLKKWKPSESIPDGFWIPDLPKTMIDSWEFFNAHGVRYYKKVAKPYRIKNKVLD